LLFLGLSDPALARLPTRDNIKRRIRKLRQEKDIIQAPNDPNFPVVPDQLTKTLRQNQFLRCDTGPGMSLNIFTYIDISISFLNCCRRRQNFNIFY
jgi:hypothetical protein